MPAPLTWTIAEPAPVPNAADDRYLVYDPRDGDLWLLGKVGENKAAALTVWRSRGDAPFVLVGRANVPFGPYYGYGYFDREAMLPAILGGSYGEEPYCGTLDGARFAAAALADLAFDSYTSAAYDPVRRALVIAPSPESDEPGTLFEVANGALRTATTTPSATGSQSPALIGFDAARGAIVWGSSETDAAALWNGSAWTPLPDIPFRFAYRNAFTAQVDGGRFAAIIPNDRGEPAELHVLDGDRWTSIDLGALRPVAAAYDERGDRAVLFLDGGGRAYVRGGRVELGDRGVPTASYAIATPSGILLSAWGRAARFAPPASPRWEPDIEGDTPDRWVHVDGREISVTRAGTLVARNAANGAEEARVEELAPAPADWKPRIWPSIAYDTTRGRLVVAAGEERDGKRKLAETWESDLRGPLALTKPKGKQPTEREAIMAFDPARGVCVMVAGVKDHNDKASGFTWEYDGAKWTPFPTTFPGKRQPKPQCLAFDDTTQQLVLVLHRSYDESELLCYVYRGEGTWELAAELECTRDFGVAIAFDAMARRLVAWGYVDRESGGVGVAIADIGAALDRARVKAPAKAASAAVAAKPAKVTAAAKPAEAAKRKRS